VGTGGPFSGVKARPGRDADHLPPFIAEVKNEYGACMVVAGQLYLLLLLLLLLSFLVIGFLSSLVLLLLSQW
jgi:hypothetical protein